MTRDDVTMVGVESAAAESPTEQQRAARRAAAERTRPLRTLQSELDARWRIVLDLLRARSRLAEGRTAYQPLEVIATAGDLIVPYMRATKAIETAGLASYEAIVEARNRRFEVLSAVTAWIAGERQPGDPGGRVVHLAATIVAGSILRRASREVLRELTLPTWTRGTCPCCGSAPEIAMVTEASRVLLCSRCDTTWHSANPGCLGCGARAAPTLGRIAAPMIGYDVTICNGCGRYLKERTGAGEIDPLVERALTAELDEAAERRGLRL